MTPGAAIALVSPVPGDGGAGVVLLRAVALTPEAAARGGVLAWEMPLAVDCRGARVRPGATTGYVDRRGTDDGVELAHGEAAWRRPPPGTPLESAWRAACDPNFRPPLAEAPLAVAAAEKTAPARPPPATAPPAPPMPAKVAAAESAGRPAAARIPDASARGGRDRVQVVSSPDASESARTLARLRRRLGPAAAELEPQVEPARVGGRTVYRGVMTGFASRADAAAFCERLRSDGQPCLVR